MRVALTLLTGPPRSGRTTAALAFAREACAAGRRVWWVGLPSQRNDVYRRATAEGGALLGLEFLTSQQVYYRLLARARRLRPLLTGNARLVNVGAALAEVADAVPSPGEARLFAYAIAEAKRFGVTPEDDVLQEGDAERTRLQQVYAAYERLTAASWDYDDFRTEALALVEHDRTACEADVLVVDGYRELGPMEFRLFEAIADARDVMMTLDEAPAGYRGTDERRLPHGPPPNVWRYRAANPVEEVRWVLRSVKRDLASGRFDPLDLAIVTPPERARAVASLTEEYGLPVMDETPSSLADTDRGRALVELLDLADYPTASRLLVVPELAPLANAALDAGVAGADAIGALAEGLGQQASLRRWLETLEVGEPPMPWATMLVRDVLPEVLRAAPSPGIEADRAVGRQPMTADEFAERALRAAQEASRLAGGASFRAWWAALLRQPQAAPAQPGGVALLGAGQVSGRQFRRLYLLGAAAGAYGAGEKEDYFVPEEDRASPAETFAQLGLPRRFQGRAEMLTEELLSRADELVVTYPDADQGGPIVPDVALLGDAVLPLPNVPAGSELELPSDERYRATREPVALHATSVEQLHRYDACAFRYWGEQLPSGHDERAWWRDLRRDLIGRGREAGLDGAALEALTIAFPEAAAWLRQHADLLSRLSFGVRLPTDGEGPEATVDAALRDGEAATLYRFTAPDRVSDQGEARAYVRERWTELWAAGHLVERYPRRIKRVGISVWPILAEPIEAYPYGVSATFPGLQRRKEAALDARRRLLAGDVTPSPGYICRDCPVFDLCREGVRS